MGFDALNFVIELVLFFLFVIILIVLARKNKMITVIFFERINIYNCNNFF